MEKDQSFESQYTDSESGASAHEDTEESTSELPRNNKRPSEPYDYRDTCARGADSRMAGASDNDSVDSEEDSSSSDEEFVDRYYLVGMEICGPSKLGKGLGAAATSLAKSPPLTNPFVQADSTSIENKESVFSVPIRDSGEHESSVLEHHVKLTPSHKSQLQINGKKICWNYRKGKCRFGSKCVYAHDSDVVQGTEKSKEPCIGSGSSDNVFVSSDGKPPDAKRLKQ